MTAIAKTTNSSPLGLRLGTGLIFGCLILLGLSLMLAAGWLFDIGRHYLDAKRGHDAIQIYREVLIAANWISAERGPTNTLLGEEFVADSEGHKRLVRFRASSDAALDRVAEMLPAERAGDLAVTRTTLKQARERVDRTLAKPFAERELKEIQQAIGGMFSAIDAIRPVITATVLSSSIGVGASLADEAQIGRKLFDLRDYAGRLGSVLNPYIAKREPISQDDASKLQQILGRLNQIWEITKPDLERYPPLASTLQRVETLFFGDGIRLIDSLGMEAMSGYFSHTTRTMTDTLVPTFAPLEELRLAYLNLISDSANAQLQSASRWLWTVGLIVSLITLVDVLLVVAMRRLIFVPLLQARDDIVALSEERDLHSPIRVNAEGSEIGELFRALNVLRLKLIERQQLTAKLEVQASMDGLTEVLNRRALDQVLTNEAGIGTLSNGIGLILLDIDKFKTINDTYGHASGDTVLKSIAGLLKKNTRESDLVARYGGEEFAIILPAAEIGILKNIAEGLREKIAGRPIDIGEGRSLNVTASFGISVGQLGPLGWKKAFQAADDALYEAKRTGRNRICIGVTDQEVPEAPEFGTNDLDRIALAPIQVVARALQQ